MKRWQVRASAAVLVVLAGAFYCTRNYDDVIRFDQLPQAQARLANLGFFCTTDCADGQLSCGFLLSRNSSSWSDVCQLRKTGSMGPEWRGKVWVTLNPSCWELKSVPDQAGIRVWGAVIAFGDDELLREIEAAL